MDPNVIAVALTVLTNVLFLGFIYGRVSTKLEALTETLKNYVERTDKAVDRHEVTISDHGTRITRLEALRQMQGGL